MSSLTFEIKTMKKFTFILLGAILVITGYLLNFAAIIFNDGSMPVIVQDERITFHHLSTHTAYTSCEGVVYCELSDVLRIKNFYFSIGDIIILKGMLVVFFNAGSMIWCDIKQRKKLKGDNYGKRINQQRSGTRRSTNRYGGRSRCE